MYVESMGSTNICEWPASLYEDKSRTWKYGILSVHAAEVVFTPDESQANRGLVSIPFVNVVDIKKSTTGLVFGAIYIVTNTNKKIWFSSLHDRNGTHSALMHFWKAQLFVQSNESRMSMGKGKTKMGQKLLSIVHDSENTLSKAAEQFYGQGRQLDHALNTIDDLHADLDVAEGFVNDLESWFGRWRLPEQYQVIDPVFVDKSEIAEVFECEVIYYKVETNRMNLRQVGSVRISKDGITLVTLKMKNEYHYRWSDVSEIRVLTPWEIMIIRHQIGKPDLKYSVVSAHMAPVLRLLDKCAKYKLKYDTPPERVLCTRNAGFQESAQTSKSSDGASRQELIGVVSNQTSSQSFTSGVDDIQIQSSEEVVSEIEANEISRRLEGLKSLAIGIQEEGNDQMEKIDCLTNAVNSANSRLEENQKRIKKLT